MKYQFNSYDKNKFTIYGIAGLVLSIILFLLCLILLITFIPNLDISAVIIFIIFYVIFIIFALYRLMKYFRFTQTVTFDEHKIEIGFDKNGTLSFPLYNLNKVEIFKSKALLNSSSFIRCTFDQNDSYKKIWLGISSSCFSDPSAKEDEMVFEKFLQDFSKQILEHQYKETSGLGIALLQLAFNSNVIENRITFVRK